MTNRQIVLDTETTGIDPLQGHRIIEIGCLEIIDRRLTEKMFHCYLNPDRDIDPGAQKVHGISREFLQDKPRFETIAASLIEFINGAELIIHNAPFDIGFLKSEFTRFLDIAFDITKSCSIIDTLPMARSLHPGQRNSLDALCKRYEIDNAHRALHGALLDADLLARVYLKMTAGQASLFEIEETTASVINNLPSEQIEISKNILVVDADEIEKKEHEEYLQFLSKTAKKETLWGKLEKEIIKTD